MAKIFLDNVRKEFFGGKVVAVDDVTLEINDKELMVLLGPSGSGKSTLIRLIAGLEHSTSGRIYLDDKDITDIPTQKRNVAMVFQALALYPHMNVYENIAFPLESIKGMSKGIIDKKVREVAKMLEIEDLLTRRPGQLSGGQQQRVAIGRALVREPNVFLMDEPFSDLDAMLRRSLRAETRKLQMETGVTMIHVTHDQEEAMMMADRIAVMHEGKVLQVDKPDEIFNHPANLFIGRFVGVPSMNTLECDLQEEGRRLTLRGKIFNFSLPQQVAEKIREKAVSKQLTLGIRPRNIFLDTTGKSPFGVDVSIELVEPLGEEAVVHFRMGDESLIGILPSDERLKVGKNVRIAFNIARAYIFDGTDSRSKTII